MAEMVNDRLYRGERTKWHTQVTVHDSPGDFAALEAPEVGWDWGRPTAGAEALAYALVRDALGADASAKDQATVEKFFHEVVLQLPFVEPWVLWRSELQSWATREAHTAQVS
ncbi:MAG: DUF6166 domain-containing protein [Candidatus Dormibacteria bacterium]